MTNNILLDDIIANEDIVELITENLNFLKEGKEHTFKHSKVQELVFPIEAKIGVF